ncbi:CubicO group peptidase (beta-lactamase class C family) [Neorhizobium galegae]|uniref:serine hydrolase domain-containing protein n=1 Tax=Neorhizobium galegae TaxID=399 RepID=UPI001FD8E626|nr:serine hydrolase domain-containing protein [Neorhizobium galegae]MBP2550972.1 CubicO group peptidase (beta-lactamase class C family) [Neorhizobium galegae]
MSQMPAGRTEALEQPFEAAFALLDQSIGSGRIPGGVLGIHDLQHGRMTRTTGLAQKVGGERIMTVDTWFDLASISKVAFTVPRILALASEGRLDLDAPVTSVIPDFRQYAPDCWERAVTFRQCLGHQTPFPAVEPIYTYGDDPERLRAFVLQREWRKGPPVYSDINYILLGIALERIEGKTIRAMEAGPGFAFSAPPEKAAATEHCMWRGRVLCGEVHDENCAALQGSGHAGLFGTVDAVLDFGMRLLEKDAAGDPDVRLMRTPLSDKRTHGWERPYEGWSGGSLCNGSVIGHTGFTGTGLWIDFDRGRAWTLLTNRVHPSRHADSGIFALRADVGDAVNTAV